MSPIRPGEVPLEAYARFVRSVVDYAMFLLDPEGRVSSWNPGARRMKGYAEEEIVGKHFSVFYPPSDVADHKPQFELRVAASEGRFEDEGWRVRKDGTMFWANVVLTAVRDDEGTLLGFAKVTRDLTERRHAEEALRQSEERHRLMVAGVKDYAIYMMDAQGRITTWNEGARRLKGYEADEIVGEHFRRFYTPEDRARGHPEENLGIALREGRLVEEGWRVRKDGTRFWASVTLTPLFDDAGRHRGFAKVTRDLTARKQWEEEMTRRAETIERSRAAIERKNAELEQANRALTTLNDSLEAFAYVVSHDLREPVRAMAALLDAAEREADPQAIHDLVGRARQSNDRLWRLIEGLLEVSRAARIDAHDLRPLDILDALSSEACQERYRALVERRGGRIDVAAAPGTPAVLASEAHVCQILGNLLANAIKHSDKAVPHVRVRVAPREDGRAVEVAVEDDGPGFDPGILDRLERLKPGRPATLRGGFGLLIARRAIERLGGRLWLGRSEDLGGASVRFVLPTPAAHEAAVGEEGAAGSAASK